jgi:signal transduction histidine kinase
MITFKEGLRRRYVWLLCLLLLLTMIGTGLFYRSMQRQSDLELQRIRVYYADRTGSFINSVFHKTDTLAAVVKLQNGNISKEVFDEIASLVYTRNSGIRGIQYMPGAVVTYSYPVAGNEGVIGKNFLKIPERLKDVELAIETRSIALSGPYNLLQGGLGVVARNPVFLKDAAGKDYFWGFSAIILDLPDALEAVGLGRLPEEGFDFQLFCINENGERLVIEGNPGLDMSKASCSPIEVPHHTWTLAVARHNPWLDLVKAGAILLIGCILSVILWLLYSQIKQKEEAIKAKDRFFADISHDMRTPLNAVIGFSSLALAPGVPYAAKDDYLEKIQSAGKLLLALINDTLTISKAESGKLCLQLAPVSTEALLASVMEPVQVLAQAKGVAVTLDTTGYKPRTILADYLNLQKIFLNILNNAVRFTPRDGKVLVTVTDVRSGRQSPDLRVRVQDTGIGIGPEFLPRLFEPFAQEQRSGYEGTGTGLGLAIVKQLVDAMGGSIKVESVKGQGSTFTVQLPFTEAAAAPVVEPVPVAFTDFSCLRGKKVLLCEDNEINKQIACALLMRQGMVVDTAVNGQVGVDKFAASLPGTYDVVLMDIRMPVLDGLAAAKAIRSLDRQDARQVPILAMTADVFPEAVQECLDAGMSAHIGKPIEAELLYRLLVQYLAAK